MSIFAVTVVGGGLGSRLAELLASDGWKVALYEREPNRHVVCGGLVSNETLLDNPFLEEYVIHRIDGAFISAGGEEITVERRGVAWVLDRDEMFRGMLERAAAEGVEIFHRPWDGKEGKVLVGADGALSSIRSRVTEEEVKYVLGVQVSVPWKEEHYVRVDFGPWSDSFFGWVIPTGEKAHVGIGVSPEKGGEAEKRLRLYLKFLGIRKRKLSLEARLIPVSPPLKRVARGDVLLVGDAAVHTKASTGGGIRFGLRGTSLARRVITRALGGEGTLEEYNALHRRELYPVLRRHWFVHCLYNELGERGIREVLRWMKESGFVEELSRRGSMDDPSIFFSLRTLPLIARTFGPVMRTLPELF